MKKRYSSVPWRETRLPGIVIIDLILVQNTDLRFFDRYDGVLASFSQALPEWDVDLSIYTPEELAAISERPFVRQAMKEGKVLYESK